MAQHLRFTVVVVSKYIGEYGHNSATAYAIADRDRANSIVSRTYDYMTEAAIDAIRLNAGIAIGQGKDC